MDIRQRLQETLGTTYVLDRELGGGGMSRVFVADEALRAKLQSVDFAELCITSGVKIVEGEGPPEAFRLPETPGVAVVVEKAPGVKCARSWKYFDPATANPRYPDITPRDAEAVMAWDAAR